MNAPRWNEVTAVFGGRFDPPHLGHREAVRGLFKNPGVKRVLLLPTPRPAYKPCIAPIEDRLEMLRLGMASAYGDEMPREIAIHDCELVRATRNPTQTTYSWDTLQELARENSPLAMVIGTDQLESLEKWHRFPDILGLCHWIILERKPHGVDQAQKAIKRLGGLGLIKTVAGNHYTQVTRDGTCILPVPTDAPGVSSTQIRETISQTGNIPENLVFSAVSNYLLQSGLYGTRMELKRPK